VQNFILPTRRLICLVLLGTVFIAAGCIFDAGTLVMISYNGCLFICSIIDLLLLPKRDTLSATRQLPEAADAGQPFEVAVQISNKSGQPLSFSLTDDLPLSFDEIKPVEGRVTGKSHTVVYNTAGRERGRYRLSFIYLRYWAHMGLWARQYRIRCEQEVKIYPDLSAIRGYLSSLQHNLILDGKRIHKKIKSGSDFHCIREYFPDDDPRLINWAASARACKIMSNVYQPERGKVVTILLDCGRMMGVELDRRVKLDRTIEAALTLAAVALRQGDQVSLLAFSNRVKACVLPGKGLPHLHAVLEAVYDLKSDLAESNYPLALEYIQRYQKKRSLLVLFSDMESYLFEDQLVPYLLRIRRIHLPLLLSLKDPQLFKWANTKAANSHLAYIKSLAVKFTLDRRGYAHNLGRMGIHLVDVPADQFTLAAVNFYLDVKSRDVL
jgi:uncharacterized protein (DUF58 family)